MAFEFKSAKKTLDICGVTYTVDVGNYKTLKTWRAKAAEIEKLAITVGDGDEIDNLVMLERELITMVLGDWERLWALSGENILVMLQLVKELGTFITTQMEDLAKQYS